MNHDGVVFFVQIASGLLSLGALVLLFALCVEFMGKNKMGDTVVIYKTSSVGCSEKPAYLVNQEAKRMLESATQKINTPYVPEIRKKVWHD